MEDLTPENVELWIDNYKRPDVINDTIRSWLDSFDFKIVNIICKGGFIIFVVIFCKV